MNTVPGEDNIEKQDRRRTYLPAIIRPYGRGEAGGLLELDAVQGQRVEDRSFRGS